LGDQYAQDASGVGGGAAVFIIALFAGVSLPVVHHPGMATTAHPSAPILSRPCETVPVDSIAIRSTNRTFVVRVPDQAMRAVGLLPGDALVCEHGVTPRQGDVVAALVAGASVLRVWSVQGGRPMLRTADGHVAAVPADGLVIQGVMVQLLRSRVR